MSQSGPQRAPSEPLIEQQRAALTRFSTPRIADLHCHLLYGVDDGPETLDESIALAEMLIASGVTDVVASAHQLGEYEFLNPGSNLLPRVRQLQIELANRSIPLRVHAGGDVRVDDRLVQLLNNRAALTIGDSGKYFLLELPHEANIEPELVMPQLRQAGFVPVLTHPERNEEIARTPSLLEAWFDAGAVIQLTAGSVVGQFGARAEAVSWGWLRAGLVHLIATDSHGPRKRPPALTACIDRLVRELNHPMARKLVVENPLHVLDGERVVPMRRRLVLPPGGRR